MKQHGTEQTHHLPRLNRIEKLLEKKMVTHHLTKFNQLIQVIYSSK